MTLNVAWLKSSLGWRFVGLAEVFGFGLVFMLPLCQPQSREQDLF
jgi:hypothetical protein